MSIRPVKRLVKSKPTREGAGVHLRRAFGFGNTSDFDPFLLLDDFRNDVPEDYLAGFPWHPHRGIETITYVLAGTVEHGDSMGNRGAIAAGDVQKMTTARTSASSAEVSGARKARWMELRPIRFIWTYRWLRERERRCPWRRSVTRSLMFLPEAASFVIRPGRCPSRLRR